MMDTIQLQEKVNSYKRTYVEINLDSIVKNIYSMKNNLPENVKMMGVIKTDGYGHGSVPIAQQLEPIDYMYGFAVATAEEALLLRREGIKKPILILGYTFSDFYERLIMEDVRFTVFCEDTIYQLEEHAKKAGCRAKVHVKVDTGMGRIGITPDEKGIQFIQELMKNKNIEIEGIFTHFAKADEYDKTVTQNQFLLFSKFVTEIEKQLGVHIPLKHCCNSAGILELPAMAMDMVRAGISLYGLYPSEEVSKECVLLTPALSWYSHIVYIKTIHKGQCVSYGGRFKASKDVVVATIPVGYGDGYPRMLSEKGYVLIHGKKAPILGRVCMDQFMVDVTDISNAKEGDLVTLLGIDGEEQISAELIGELSGRFNYELVCDIGKRVPRVYTKEGKVIAIKDHFSVS